MPGDLYINSLKLGIDAYVQEEFDEGKHYET